MADPDTAPEYAAGVRPHPRHDRSEDHPCGAARRRAWWPFASIAAFVSSGRLDRALATGTDPTAGLLLERRGAQLTSRRARRLAADVLGSHLVRVRKPRTGLTAAIPVQRGELLRASRETRLLIEILRADGDVRAQGMARIHRLLSDGASPLYADSPRGTLAQTLIAATECMRDEH
jgi:hypothetical protein